MFSELYPEIPIIAAGSLLGVALNREGAQEGRISWPVGKVSYLDLYPMNFREFLWAMGEDGLADFIQLNTLSALEVFHEKYESLFRSYLFLGGMPAVVQAYLDSHLYSEARQIQLNLLRDYEHDFSKHVSSPMEVEHIREVFASIPTQIARETQSNKFIYSQVKPGGRGREYKDAIRWLVDAGLVIKVNKVSRPGIPLKTYEDTQSFKLYLLDVGLLGAELELDEKSILLGSNLFTHGKGVYAEQFVCEQLISASCSLYYWSADGKKQKGELDFIYSYEGDVYPIEVKADENIKSKSIAVFSQQYSIPKSIRLSLRGFQDNGWLVNIPLYAANILPVSLGDKRK